LLLRAAIGDVTNSDERRGMAVQDNGRCSGFHIYRGAVRSQIHLLDERDGLSGIKPVPAFFCKVRVFGLQQRGPRLSEKGVGIGGPHQPHHGGVDEHDSAGLMNDHGVGRLLGKTSKATLALSQRQLCTLALGDVFRHAEQILRVSVSVEDGEFLGLQ